MTSSNDDKWCLSDQVGHPFYLLSNVREKRKTYHILSYINLTTKNSTESGEEHPRCIRMYK